MRLFVIAGSVPYSRDGVPGVTAVNIVTYELLHALLDSGHDVVLQMLFNAFRTTPVLAPSEVQALDALRARGMVVLPPVFPEAYLRREDVSLRSRRWARFLGRLTGQVRVEDYYAAAGLRGVMAERLRAHEADAILSIWSPEGVAATYQLRDWPKLAYHGDPDFHPIEVRGRDPGLFPTHQGRRRWFPQALRAWRGAWGLAGLKQAHLALMRDVDVIGNIMAANADWYTRQGHPNSLYLRSLWRDPEPSFPGPAAGAEGAGRDRQVKIIGHAGSLSATGGTYGLQYLLVDVLPRLESVMAGLDYEVHVFGGGQIAPSLRPHLEHPRVVRRGFVQDYDQALRSSDVFLLLNNAGPYRGAHTRQIIAWAMGLCLVVHANSRQAIPETRHLENALVGETPEEIARLIRMAATDPELNRRIRRGGRATYERYFRPRLIAEAMSRELTKLVAGSSVVVGEATCAATS